MIRRWRERRAARLLMDRLIGSRIVDGYLDEKSDEVLIVESWLWGVLGEDEVAGVIRSWVGRRDA